MDFLDDEITQLVDIWRDEFGEEISLDDARSRAQQLMELLVLLALPVDHESAYDEHV